MIVVVTIIDSWVAGRVRLCPTLAAAPAIAASYSGPMLTGMIGALAVGSQVVIGAVHRDLSSTFIMGQIAATAVISLLLVLFCHRRERRTRELDQVRSVSEATQRVVLRPLPHRMGPLRIASIYLAAQDAAQIGGDLYAATRTGAGARLIIGDVRGKGLTAISDASVLMGAFREAAHRCATLPELAVTLECSICRHLAEHISEADEEFQEHLVTTLLLDIPAAARGPRDHPARPPPRPPLGIDLPRTGCTLDAFTFEDDDTLLLYTDGAIEARGPDRSFYPLTERVAQWTGSSPEALLHHIRDDLIAHVGGRLGDDAAMVVIQRSPKLQPGHQLEKMIHINGSPQDTDAAPDARATPHPAPGQE
ncbi:PP2C family protein-serine/threonine phosphatase [Actinacidiphila soli]|uniref:PP2C family protein-serine/threonine phosphatase n=1 Tax=Actinacidiphila soli TaxID=2487275 RepID=UPI001F0C547E|nr:PP2C family protein-serine/threonine phosphatase [Actinacidiphila soli]